MTSDGRSFCLWLGHALCEILLRVCILFLFGFQLIFVFFNGMKDLVFIIEIVLVITFFFVFIINSYNKQKCPLINSCATFRLLGLRVRISPGAWASLSSECCMFSGRDLCDGRSLEVCVFVRARARVCMCVCVCVRVCMCV